MIFLFYFPEPPKVLLSALSSIRLAIQFTYFSFYYINTLCVAASIHEYDDSDSSAYSSEDEAEFLKNFPKNVGKMSL